MKVEFTFDKEQIQQYGYTVDTVRQTIQKNFAAKDYPAFPMARSCPLWAVAAKKISLICGPF